MPGGASALKRVRIYDRISPYNARHYLASLCHWLPDAGQAGLVVVLDMRPYEHRKPAKGRQAETTLLVIREALQRGATPSEVDALARVAEEAPPVDYGPTAYMQLLSLIRHFIDEIDRFGHFLLVVLTSPQFYDMASPRSYFNYDALQTRIGLEVHDTVKADPAASLVHLGVTQ